MQDGLLTPKQSKKIAYFPMADEENLNSTISLGATKTHKDYELVQNEEENTQTNITQYESGTIDTSLGAATRDNEEIAYADDAPNTSNYNAGSALVTSQSRTPKNAEDPVDAIDPDDAKRALHLEDPDQTAKAATSGTSDEKDGKESDGKPPPPISRQNSDDEEEQDTPDSQLICQYLEEMQDVVEKTKNKKDKDSVLNSVDREWDYNLTIGDVEKRRVKNLPGKDPDDELELWFPIKGKVRKVFTAIKVKRVSDVDNVAETFRMRFHIYFNWLMTEKDYRSYLNAKATVAETKSFDALMNWEPSWYPHLEFQNAIEEHIKEWEVYPENGRFRVQKFKDFAKEKKEKIDPDKFDCDYAYFIRAKLECEMTFAEELELQSFPFDCQDLSCVIHERTTGGVKCRFLPELRKPNFASVDPRYSVIDEWDLETAILEFGDANASASRSKTSYAMIVLRLKMKRRWKVFLWNIVFLMMCICALALCSFALDADSDLGERLNLIITLVLTAVAFSYVVFENLPNVPYLTFMDRYILCGYSFLVCTMIESALAGFWIDYDWIFFIIACCVFVSYHVGFALYAKKIRKEEEEKLFLSSDDVEREVNLSRPSLEFNYKQRLRAGKNGRLLSFLGTIKIPDSMKDEEKEKLKEQQRKLQDVYQRKAEGMQFKHFNAESLLKIDVGAK